jgi:hypothetical protein
MHRPILPVATGTVTTVLRLSSEVAGYRGEGARRAAGPLLRLTRDAVRRFQA